MPLAEAREKPVEADRQPDEFLKKFGVREWRRQPQGSPDSLAAHAIASGARRDVRSLPIVNIIAIFTK
jgi:hypothetical protein